VYEGDFKNDFKNGNGKESYKSGELFEGTFLEGDKVEGVLYDINGNSVFIKNETWLIYSSFSNHLILSS
jgi:hypothetical protein